MKEGWFMKILKIEDNKGYFHCEKISDWKEIDQIDRESLMLLLNACIEKDVVLDDFDKTLLGNQAQQIIYKSIHEKFSDLIDKKDKFLDESGRTYLVAIQKYQSSENSSE